MRKINKLFITVLASASLLTGVLTACGGSNEQPEVVSVESVSVSSAFTSMTIGEVKTLTAKVMPTNATTSDVSWASSNTAVASVDETGKVTALTIGSTDITVTTKEGGYKATCVVNVIDTDIPVSGVTLDKTSATIELADEVSLVATVSPANAANKKVFWRSSNPLVALVDSEGCVTGLSKGFSKITVSTLDGGHTATCIVTVNNTNTITVVETDHVTANVPTSANEGEKVTINFEFETGYFVEKVMANDVVCGSENDGFFFEMPGEPVVITPVVLPSYDNMREVINTTSDIATIHGITGGLAEVGSDVVFDVTIRPGYSFKGIGAVTASDKTPVDIIVANENGYKFVMPEDDVEITVEYEALYFAFNVVDELEAFNRFYVDGKTTRNTFLPCGSSVTVEFDNTCSIYGDGKPVGINIVGTDESYYLDDGSLTEVTFTMPAKSITITPIIEARIVPVRIDLRNAPHMHVSTYVKAADGSYVEVNGEPMVTYGTTLYFKVTSWNSAYEVNKFTYSDYKYFGKYFSSSVSTRSGSTLAMNNDGYFEFVAKDKDNNGSFVRVTEDGVDFKITEKNIYLLNGYSFVGKYKYMETYISITSSTPQASNGSSVGRNAEIMPSGIFTKESTEFEVGLLPSTTFTGDTVILVNGYKAAVSGKFVLAWYNETKDYDVDASSMGSYFDLDWFYKTDVTVKMNYIMTTDEAVEVVEITDNSGKVIDTAIYLQTEKKLISGITISYSKGSKVGDTSAVFTVAKDGKELGRMDASVWTPVN